MKRAREGGTGEGHSQGQYHGVQQSFSPADKNTSFKGAPPRSREKQRKENLLSASSWILREVLFLLGLFGVLDAFSALLFVFGKMQKRNACPAALTSYSSV